MARRYRTPRQVFVLAAILKAHSMTGKELASVVEIPKSDAYSWLAVLTKKGLLSRKRIVRSETLRPTSLWVLDGLAKAQAAKYRREIMHESPNKVQNLLWLGLAVQTLWMNAREKATHCGGNL